MRNLINTIKVLLLFILSVNAQEHDNTILFVQKSLQELGNEYTTNGNSQLIINNHLNGVTNCENCKLYVHLLNKEDNSYNSLEFGVVKYDVFELNTKLNGNEADVLEVGNINGNSKHQESKYYNINPAAQYHIELTEIPSNLSEDLILRLELRGLANNVMDDNPTNFLSNITTDDFIHFSWDAIKGANYYELDYIFYPTNVPYNLEGENCAFHKDVIRIQTKDTELKIPNVFPNGKICSKVRGVSHNEESRSSWKNIDNDDGIQGVLVNNIDTEKSWTSTKQFAENGLNQTTLNYFDDLLRPKQTLTSNNEDNLLNISEYYYDAEGREAIKIIPAPALGNYDYKPSFNKSSTNQPINILDIEEDQPLSSQDGASKYFSNNNNLTGIHQSFIPDAEEFPYVSKKYSRNKYSFETELSGIGLNYKIGSGHELKKYYLSATNTEIQRLFGREIGSAEGFTKIITKDPNNQYSAEYYNRQNQIVATCLLGPNPKNVKALESYVESEPTEIKLSSGTVTKEGSISVNKLFVSSPQQVNFAYSFDKIKEEVGNLASTGCYNCSYVIQFSIIDPCGNLLDISNYNSTDGDISIEDKKLVIDLGVPTIEVGACASEQGPSSSNTIQINFASQLIEIGEYQIIKELKVNPLPIDELEQFVLNSLDISEIEQEFEVNPDDCNYNAAKECYREIISNPMYSGIDPDSKLFQSLVNKCVGDKISFSTDIVNQTPQSYCSTIYNQLLASIDPNSCPDWDFYKIFDIPETYDQFHRIELKIYDKNGYLYHWHEVNNNFVLDYIDEFSDTPDVINVYGSSIILKGKNEETSIFNLSDSEDVKNLLTSKNYFQSQFADFLLGGLPHVNSCKYDLCDQYFVADRHSQLINGMSYIDFREMSGYPVSLTNYPENEPIRLGGLTNDELFKNFLNLEVLGKQVDLEISGQNYSISVFSDCDILFKQYIEEKIQEIDNMDQVGVDCANQSLSCFVSHVRAIWTKLNNEGATLSEFELFKALYNEMRRQYIDKCSGCNAYDVPCSPFNSMNIGTDYSTVINDVLNTSFENPDINVCKNNIDRYITNIIEHFYDWQSMTESQYNTVKENLLSDQLLMEHLDYMCMQLSGQVNLGTDISDVFLVSNPPDAYFDNCIGFDNVYGDNNVGHNGIYESIIITPTSDESYFPTSLSCLNEDVYDITGSAHYVIPIFDKEEKCNSNYSNTERIIVNLTEFEMESLEQLGEKAEKFLQLLQVSVSAFIECSPKNPTSDPFLLHELDCTINMDIHKNIIIEFERPDLPYKNYMLSFFKLKDKNATTSNLVNRFSFYYNAGYDEGESKIFGDRAILSLNSLIQLRNYLFENWFENLSIDQFEEQMDAFYKDTWKDYKGCYQGNECFENIFNSLDLNFDIDGEFIKDPIDLKAECNEEIITCTYTRNKSECKVISRVSGNEEINRKLYLDFLINSKDYCLNNSLIRFYTEDGMFYNFFYTSTGFKVIGVEPSFLPSDYIYTPELTNYTFTGYSALIKEKLSSEAETIGSRYIRVYLFAQNKAGCMSLVSPCETYIDEDQYKEDCLQSQIDLLQSLKNKAIKTAIKEGVDQIIQDVDCMDGVKQEFTCTKSIQEYHYTLYYYDRLGNVYKTIPPEGVAVFPNSMFEDGVLLSSAPNAPPHNENHVTKYEYNGLNLVVKSDSKDGGVTTTEYDVYNRPRKTSYADGRMDAVAYDDLNRVILAGEVESDFDVNDFNYPSENNIKAGAATYYSPHPSTSINQDNIRNRVSYVKRLNKSQYGEENEMVYNYDIHGNVKEIEYRSPFIGNKTIQYDYDLVSGSVKNLIYNKGQPDQFFHKYFYDKNNRIKYALSSNDAFYWDQEARYYYYLHGPLARTEIGENQIQGIDHFYTIQGWIKGINMIGDNLDLAQDGISASNNPFGYFAADQLAYGLLYHDDDYRAISGTQSPELLNLFSGLSSKFEGNSGLYNGNIVAMAIDQVPFYKDVNPIYAFAYKYDQLHRIIESNDFKNSGNSYYFAGHYFSNYDYDGNGNLYKLNRRHNNDELDKLSYSYSDPTKPNRLTSVFDANSNTLDFDFEGVANYVYDNRGNLINTSQNGSYTSIDWFSNNKIEKVDITGNAGEDHIYYEYDAMGNRIAKYQYIETYEPPNVQPIYHTVKGTYYVRDASGNTLASYTFEKPSVSTIDEVNYRKEFNIYGSDRLGMDRSMRNMLTPQSNTLTRVRNQKVFELKNHLGNVLTTVSDYKINQELCSAAVIFSEQNYYPFGQEIKGLSSESERYRYGFNGKEKDTESVWNSTMTYDYGFRIYNPSIARFLSVDPLTRDYPWYTPYQFAGNMPIVAIDLDGLEPEVVIDKEGNNTSFMKAFLKSALAIEVSSVNDPKWYKLSEFNGPYWKKAAAKQALTNGFAAITLENQIIYKDSYAAKSLNDWLATSLHEHVHVQQWKDRGSFGFLIAYGLQTGLTGYGSDPTEKLAYDLDQAFTLWNAKNPELVLALNNPFNLTEVGEYYGKKFRLDVGIDVEIDYWSKYAADVLQLINDQGYQLGEDNVPFEITELYNIYESYREKITDLQNEKETLATESETKD